MKIYLVYPLSFEVFHLYESLDCICTKNPSTDWCERDGHRVENHMSSYSHLCFYYICHAKMGCNQLFISGNYLLYDEILFKMLMTVCCVSWRRMQNPIFKVILQLHESSHGRLETVTDNPSSASDVSPSATWIEDTIPQMQASHWKDSWEFPVK